MSTLQIFVKFRCSIYFCSFSCSAFSLTLKLLGKLRKHACLSGGSDRIACRRSGGIASGQSLQNCLTIFVIFVPFDFFCLVFVTTVLVFAVTVAAKESGVFLLKYKIANIHPTTKCKLLIASCNR